MLTMFMLSLSVTLFSILVLLVSLIFFVISKKTFFNIAKLSPFECGFSPWENSRQSFSLQFFMVSLIFLVFDVELIILFPVISITPILGTIKTLMIFTVFFLFMVGGLVLEWSSKKLDWMK